ncbi:MAG: SGNH/GDSL hydrolase family protein [Burkholderiales bacterium]|nr:SGNH/GDSL hydrolase family protein [Burkholderiales bacterium]MDE2432327.1 SGNH/GDSL hydrolase family protein [Burkholderiales bacterium]
MRDTLTQIALGPLLLAQGLYTRRVTPKLPEASGDRQGICGQGPLLRVLIAGDSAAAGVGAAHQQEALAGQIVATLSDTHTVHWRLVAQTGLTTEEVLRRLSQHEPEPVDIAVVSVGVNDVTSRIQAAAWRSQLQALASELIDRHQARHILFAPVPPMHLFPALPQPLRWYLGSRAKAFNHELANWAGTQASCELLDMRLPLNPELMASDGFHPGPALYRIWAEYVVRAIQTRPLRP